MLIVTLLFHFFGFVKNIDAGFAAQNLVHFQVVFHNTVISPIDIQIQITSMVVGF